MSSLSELFSFGRPAASDELPNIYPMALSQTDFVQTDVVTIFSKILVDTLERTNGLNDDQFALMWDNCVKSSSSDGLITILSKGMLDKKELFIVYEKAVGVIRLATPSEVSQIKEDYSKKASSSVGVFVSFQNFKRSDMIRFYSGIDYCNAASLYKSMNISKAVQLKMSDMRASVSLTDSADVKNQAQSIARGLAAGKDVLLDAKDIIETAAPDLKAVQESVAFVIKKLSFYLGMPEAYLAGEQTGGLGTTGENDTKAVERGLKSYFFSVIKPVVDALFGISVTYKSQDFRQIAGAMEVVKTFALVDDTMISADNKRIILNGLLDLPSDAKGDAPKKADLAPAPARAPAVPNNQA